MKEVKFKVGDLVYYAECKEICKIINVFSKNIVLDVGKGKIKIRLCIPTLSFFGVPAPIFHATQENYELLCRLYGMEFEPPPKRKEPREIIEAMFDSGKWHLVNYCIKNNNVTKNKVIIKQFFQSISFDDYFNRYAFCNIDIICPNTGKTIIDFVDGEVILENENADE